MAFTNVFDDTFPADTELANLAGSNLRQVRLDVQQRMAAISGVSTSMPAFASDAQPSSWNGILFFATDNGHVYQFNNPTWTDITSSLLPQRTLSWLSSSGGGAVGASTTLYFPINGSGGSATETNMQVVMAAAGSFKAFYAVTTTTQPSGGALTFTLRKNAAAQALTFIVAASATAGTYSDTAHTVSFNAGDLIDIQVVNAATANSAAIQSFGLQY